MALYTYTLPRSTASGTAPRNNYNEPFASISAALGSGGDWSSSISGYPSFIAWFYDGLAYHEYWDQKITLNLSSAQLTALSASFLFISITYAGSGGQTVFEGTIQRLSDLTLLTSVPGCTNPAALNYNPAATVDNGSCIMPVLGCTNAGATNYNPAANVDNGSCTFAPVPGCTNPRAINYNPSATTDNGSCILPVPGCTIAGSLNYNPAANVNDGSCIPITRGCTVPGAVNYSASANVDNGSCVYPAAPGTPAASVSACCNWTDGDVVLQAAWRSVDNCGNNTFIVITSPSATIAAQAAQIAALQSQVLALAHIDEGILP